MINLKKGIQVKIISGKDKGKTGEILEINRSENRLKVKTINMIKKHLKPTKENKGGIISKENFIHVSNVKNIDKVFYTHAHADQTHGINELRVFYLKNKKKIDVYADKSTKEYLLKSFRS